MDLARGDQAEQLQDVRGAVFVGGGTAAGVEAEDGVLERLEGFEELVDPRVERGAPPHPLRLADERTGRNAGTDEEGQAHLDGRGDPKSSPLWGAKSS